jgi:ribosomal protein L7/L12
MIANEYFQSYSDYFWQWEDNAEVIAIPNYSTIAYRAFITEVLAKLSDQGVPPFGALLMAMIATNPRGEIVLDVLYQNFNKEIKKEGDNYLVDAFIFLKLLSEVPEEYKKGNKRVLLLQALFENCHNIFSVKKSKEIVHWFDFNTGNVANITIKKELNPTVYNKDFRTISLLGTRYRSVDEIIKKIASLPDITETIIPKEDISRGNNKNTFIDELISDNRTFQLGILAERILSGLNVPFHRSLADQQPLGGISDLTNKGSFDKLLLSEFANEDILFLSRLANNEALYIEREIPPSNNTLKRVFLIDASLRNWGTPKLIAFATVVAIAKAPKSTIECSTFAIGHSVKHVSLDSIHALIDGLQVLESSADASSGLALYFKENPPNKDTELFFLTETSSAKQTAMYNSMSIYGSFINYYIHTDFDGNIDVFKKQQKSLKHIQHIQLPLDELSKRKPITVSKLVERNTKIEAYPVLVRNPSNVKQLVMASDGQIFQMTSEKALLRLFDKSAKKHEKGWIIIQNNLPFVNGLSEIGIFNKEYIFLLFNPNKKEVCLLNANTGARQIRSFNEYDSKNGNGVFCYYKGDFYNKSHNNIFRISIDGNIELDTKAPKELFENQEKEIIQEARSYMYSQGILKNIQNIYINESERLVFNVHQLHITSHQHIKLDRADNTIKVNESIKNADGEFVFRDGSSIEVNRIGILILKSSNESIPLIYLPSVIDSTLGVATDADFAGNGYYYKDKQFELLLTDPGNQRVSIVKLIQEQTGLGLKRSKEIVDACPSSIMCYISDFRAVQIKRALEAEGAIIEMKEMDQETQLNKVSTTYFYENYIEAFVKTIQSYGTKN